MNDEQRRQKFYQDASKLVGEFIQEVQSGSLSSMSAPSLNSPLYDREALAKYHRAVWLNWARGQDDAKVGWLIDYHSQTESHKEVQRRQAEELFAMGYLARVHDEQTDREPHRPIAFDGIQYNRKATIQAFTQTEARLMLAAVMKFLEHTMKKHNIVMSKNVVDRLLRKLEILADVKVDHVDYFVPADKEGVSKRLKPKWKRDNPKNKQPVSKPVGRVGLGSYMKAKQ